MDMALGKLLMMGMPLLVPLVDGRVKVTAIAIGLLNGVLSLMEGRHFYPINPLILGRS